MCALPKFRLSSSIITPLLAVLAISGAAVAQRYSQTNLVSNIPGMAAVTDPHLENSWGISFGPTSPFWVADSVHSLPARWDSCTAGGNHSSPHWQRGAVRTERNSFQWHE